MDRIDYEAALFDVLEAIAPHFPRIGGGFARYTGGFERDYVLSILRSPDASPDSGEAAREAAYERAKSAWEDRYNAGGTTIRDCVVSIVDAVLAAPASPSSSSSGADWQPIETCPTDSKAFFVWSPSCNLRVAYGRDQDGSFGNATHWMRPSPPGAPSPEAPANRLEAGE